MKVLEPKELELRRDKRTQKQKSKRRKRAFLPLLIVVIVLYVGAVLVMPLAALQTTTTAVPLPHAGPVSLLWPSYGQAAVGAVGYGLLAQNGDEKPLPTASVAKVITAVTVLKVRPMQPGTQGETITITPEDVATYNKYVAQDQSSVRVEAGEKITEYQALQALLLPSANNMADILVRWAFGTTQDYLTFVNPFVKTLGMAKTNIDDASGFSPKTTSTAVDLTKLAEIAMNHPIISEIVGQKDATIPVAGKIYNYNTLLGNNGIVGVKTGNTDEAGGCYMFAAKRDIAKDKSVTVVGVIMGAPNLETVINGATPLINEAYKNFQVTTPLPTGTVVGEISQPGGVQVPIQVREGVPVVSWIGQAPRADVHIKPPTSHVSAGDDIGNITLSTGNMSYQLSLSSGGSIAKRSYIWRLRHAAGYL